MSPNRLYSWAAAVATVVALGTTVRSEGPTPSQSLARLKAGNATFVSNPGEALPVDAARRATVAKGHAPFAAVLSCADAAVPPELVFHAGLGDLFVVRAAGPVADRSVLASLEYAIEELHVPLVLVMGHEACGVIRAGLDHGEGHSIGPNFDHILKQIRAVAGRTTAQGDVARLRAAILENVEEQINELLQDSATLRRHAETPEFAIVGAYYELASGIVHFSEPVRFVSAADATRRNH